VKKETMLILHNIRSNHNVGSIFRTGDAAGVKKIFLTGYTPTPLDKFGREVKETSKTALGAEKSIKWEKNKNVKKVIENLKREGFYIVAIEQAKNSVDYKKVKSKNKVAFILGNEVTGLLKSVLSLCDIIAEIPMKGKKESLNVSVSAGIALFRILNI
jgi:tRNA G18 (ribose-2'-O)-methylase SpoU